jgi:hypothetical protein
MTLILVILDRDIGIVLLSATLGKFLRSYEQFALAVIEPRRLLDFNGKELPQTSCRESL